MYPPNLQYFRNWIWFSSRWGPLSTPCLSQGADTPFSWHSSGHGCTRWWPHWTVCWKGERLWRSQTIIFTRHHGSWRGSGWIFNKANEMKWNALFKECGNILFWLEAVTVHWKCPYGRLAAIDKSWYSLQKPNDYFTIRFSIEVNPPFSHRGKNKQFW